AFAFIRLRHMIFTDVPGIRNANGNNYPNNGDTHQHVFGCMIRSSSMICYNRRQPLREPVISAETMWYTDNTADSRKYGKYDQGDGHGFWRLVDVVFCMMCRSA